ncbi:MAG: hypothetical protein KF768_03950 [Phycisphaeraceae bacterium]|nr:hypothetical protein [Phycisphaeraceae bacterium]
MPDAPAQGDARTHDPDALLREFVADRDAPCPACRYNLRNLTADRCPECGLPLTLRVGLADPAWGAYIAALVGFSVGLGFCSIVGAWGLVEAFFRHGVGRAIGFLPLVLGVLACGAGTAFLLKRRHAFIKWAPSARKGFAVLAWLAGIGFPFLFWAMIVR